VSVTGDQRITLCELPNTYPRGGVWQPDGTIIFGVANNTDFNRTGILYSVSSQGGEPVVYRPDIG
jgi:hypothetical protein